MGPAEETTTIPQGLYIPTPSNILDSRRFAGLSLQIPMRVDSCDLTYFIMMLMCIAWRTAVIDGAGDCSRSVLVYSQRKLEKLT